MTLIAVERKRRAAGCFGLGLLAVFGVPISALAAAQAGRAMPAESTRHVAHVNGQALPYTATVAGTVIPDAKGQPGAEIVTISYTRDGIRDAARRPVMFLFNGGPGASSSPLHMSGMGPVLHSDDSRDRAALVYSDNPTTPLDVTDLVFIDPVSTGFSRALPGIDAKQWYGVESDAREVARVMQAWLRLHHREASPLFLCGESYGTTRAGQIVKDVPDLKFRGVLLISGGAGSSGPNATAIDRVGTMAAAAWYHDKVDRRGMTVQAFYAAAMQFARGEYAAALAQGPGLSASELHRVAMQLSGYIGLPASLIERKKLRIDANTFMFHLLREQGLRIGLLDTRVTSELKPNAAGGIDDPSLGVVTPVTGGPVPTPAAVGAVVSPAVGYYLTHVLRFPSSEPYYGVNFLANSQWVFATKDGGPVESTAVILARAMRADRHLKVFAASGLYDLRSTDGAGFLLNGVPADRLTLDMFAGPHEVYTGAENRARFDNDVRRFVLAAK